MAAPLVRLTVGDITKVGLQKLPYGPNTQIKNDRHIPLLDIGTMEHIKAGRITVHGGDRALHRSRSGLRRRQRRSTIDAVVLGTGYEPGLDELLPEWRAVCDDTAASAGERRPESALPGLWFCGQFVSPAGMLREMGLEARRIATAIPRSPPRRATARGAQTAARTAGCEEPAQQVGEQVAVGRATRGEDVALVGEQVVERVVDPAAAGRR